MNQYEELIVELQDAYNLKDLKIVKPYHNQGENYVLLHEFFGNAIPVPVFRLLFTTMLGEPHVRRSDVGIFVTFEILAASLLLKQKMDEADGTEKERQRIYTYVMYDASTEAYKIGQSVDPVHREKTLQAEKPTIKTILLCSENHEYKLHRLFDPKRIRGEWFKLEADDLLLMIEEYGFIPS